MNMSNFASTIKIENFKSIQSLELNDCKRINLFIGRPNVGKSNILEALSLFSLPYQYKYRKNSLLSDIIRVSQSAELFFDGESKYNSAYITIDHDKIVIYDLFSEVSIDFFINPSSKDASFFFTLKSNLNLDLNNGVELDDYLKDNKYRYKSYLFPKDLNFKGLSSLYLLPVKGKNLYNVIQNDSSLKNEFLDLFKDYGLNLVFDKASQELKIMKGIEKGDIFLIPFNSIADSLQRLIFFKTAIKSNTDSIITFEEPEAHTYPPYIAQIAQDIIAAKTNQFFITTHSPYVVTELLENAQEELAIYLVDFKNGKTIARRLSDTQLDEVYNNGIDLFFNNELFL